MKFTNLFAILLAALFIIGCGAKEEEVVDGGNNNEIVDENIDDSNVPNVIGDNNWDEDLNPADSSSQETMTYNENTQEVQIDPPVEETTQVVEEKKETVLQKRFYIVVGSFKEYGNAQKLNEKFKKEGYYPMILPKVNEYNRVAIASYVEEANARKAIKKLRAKYNDLTFWLYKW